MPYYVEYNVGGVHVTEYTNSIIRVYNNTEGLGALLETRTEASYVRVSAVHVRRVCQFCAPTALGEAKKEWTYRSPKRRDHVLGRSTI